jgi:hypothetical protein
MISSFLLDDVERIGPKERWLTTWERFATVGLMLWCLDLASMWKLPGTLLDQTV